MLVKGIATLMSDADLSCTEVTNRMPTLRMGERTYAAGVKMRLHAHALPSMSVLIHGALRERAGRATETALPFSVSFMAADVRHDDEFGPEGATMFQVFFTPEDRGLIDACSAMSGWSWSHAGAIGRQFARLAMEFRENKNVDLYEQRVVDILATGASDDRARGPAPAWLDDIRELIDDLDGWPRVADIAATARVHRVYLARQFRRYFGCSVSDYIRRRRVQAAASRISTRGKTLSEVAHECGFHDHSHLCRAFRRECAMSPSEFARRPMGVRSPLNC
jgi:AraC family transcriptional regulator